MSAHAFLPSVRHASTRGPVTRPALRVVGPPRHSGRYVLAILVVAVAGVVGVVSLSALAAEASFATRSLRAEVSDLSVRYDELTAEVSSLEAPERIRTVAERDLGMVPASSPVFLVDGAPGETVAGLAASVEPAPGE